MLSSSKAFEASGVPARFDAVVSVYPPCRFYPKDDNPPPYTLILPGINRPLLLLLGGKDTETPPDECMSDLRPHKDAGAPIEWHLYPKATHRWDCRHLHRLKRIDVRGSSVEYLYDDDVTRDSAIRMFRFFEEAFSRRP